MAKTVRIDSQEIMTDRGLELLADPEIELACDRCGAPLEIVRRSAGPKDAAGRYRPVLIRCAEDAAHFDLHLHYRSDDPR